MHHAPTTLDEQDVAKVQRVVTGAAHAQGLRRSVFHAEVRFHEGEPYMLEIAARVGGGGLDTIARITADYDPIRGGGRHRPRLQAAGPALPPDRHPHHRDVPDQRGRA